jgi:hypothetical protein
MRMGSWRIQKKLKIEYEKEGRFGLGVAATKSSEDYDPLGVRMLAYNYSGKTLISIKEKDAKRREELTRVQNLKGGLPWVVSNREAKRDNFFLMTWLVK